MTDFHEALWKMRREVDWALEAGNWRRLLLMYGEHHPECPAFLRSEWPCECGFKKALYPVAPDKQVAA